MKNKKLMIGATLLLTLSAASAFSVDTRPALKRRDRVMSIEAGGHKFVGSVMERFRDRKSGQYMVRIDLGWDAGEVTRPEKSLIRAVRSIGDIKKGHGVIEADRANHY